MTTDELDPLLSGANCTIHEPAAHEHATPSSAVHTGQRPGDEALAKYLASINLSAQTTWNFQFKSLPRPKGKATKVIYTEYDLPRKDAEPHDVMLDSEGMIWYIDFAEADFEHCGPPHRRGQGMET